MRIPHVHRLSAALSDAAPSETITIGIEPREHIDDLGLFEDRSEYLKFIFRTERLIRNSFEYTKCIEFLKKKHGLDHCGIHPNLKSYYGFRIELHHAPITLFDIVHVIATKRRDKGESLKMGEIANEVVMVHYLGLVGLYPLCGLCHLAIHGDDPFFIPNENVFGDPDTFYDIYKEYFTDGMKQKYESIQQLNKGYSLIENHIPKELQKQYIYVQAKSEDGSDTDAISTTKLVSFINELSKPDK